jgi:hypothetical protein
MSEKPAIDISHSETRFEAPQQPERIETVWGKIRVVSAVPDWTPRGRQEDSMALYVNGTTQRLYFYDFSNNVWRKFTNTTVAADGSSALEGDVVIAGDGIDVNQSGQTITIGSGIPFVGKDKGSFTSSDVAPNKDITFSVGFDPKMIHFYGLLDDGDLGSSFYFSSIIQASSPTISSTPHIWLNDGTYPIGRQEEDTNPVVFTDHTNAFLKSDLGGTAFEFSVIVQSHSDSQTVIRIRRDVGSGDRVVGYKFVLIFYP